MYVLEGRPEEIRVFDSTGAYVRTIGRSGSGPGEFQQAAGMAWDSPGRLWVVNQANGRYTVLDTAGHVLMERPRPVSGFFVSYWPGMIDRQDRLYEMVSLPGGQPFRRAVVRLDSSLAPRIR